MSIEKLSTNASLKDVMDKFEEISLQDFSSIDIITEAVLPNEVKNGQIVVVTETNPSEITLYFDKPSNPSEGDIWIKCFYESREKFYIKAKNKKIELNVFGAEQYVRGEFVSVDSYIGVNNEWVSMNKFYLFNGEKASDYTDLFTSKKSNNYYAFAGINGDHICVKESCSGATSYTSYCITKEKYDLTPYKKIFIDYSYSDNNQKTDSSAIQLIASTGTLLSIGKDNVNISRTVEEIDITNINAECQVKIVSAASSNGGYNAQCEIRIYNMWLE